MASNGRRGSSSNGQILAGTVAEFKSFVDGELDGVQGADNVLPHVAYIDDPALIRKLNRLYAAWERLQAESARIPYFYDLPAIKMVMRNVAGPAAAQSLADGNLSRLRGMVGDTRDRESYQTGIGHILEEMRKEAYTGMILADPNAPGAQNVGKTATALSLSVGYKAFIGGDVATNIPVNRGQGIKHVETESELKAWLKDSDTYLPLIILDEVDQFLSAKYGSKKAVKKMTEFIREIRKDPWYARIILIGHVEKGIEPDIRQMANHVIAKRSKKVIAIYSTHEDMGRGKALMMLRNAPDTPVRYEEHQQPRFDFDEDVHEDRPVAEEIATRFINEYEAGEADAKSTVRPSKRPQDDGKLIVDKSRLETYYELEPALAKKVKVLVEDQLL